MGPSNACSDLVIVLPCLIEVFSVPSNGVRAVWSTLWRALEVERVCVSVFELLLIVGLGGDARITLLVEAGQALRELLGAASVGFCGD